MRSDYGPSIVQPGIAFSRASSASLLKLLQNSTFRYFSFFNPCR